MVGAPIPTAFEESYRNFDLYPTNLILQATYSRVLDDYRSRLDSDFLALFTKVEDIEDNGSVGHMDVGFCDFDIGAGNHASFWCEFRYTNHLRNDFPQHT